MTKKGDEGLGPSFQQELGKRDGFLHGIREPLMVSVEDCHTVSRQPRRSLLEASGRRAGQSGRPFGPLTAKEIHSHFLGKTGARCMRFLFVRIDDGCRGGGSGVGARRRGPIEAVMAAGQHGHLIDNHLPYRIPRRGDICRPFPLVIRGEIHRRF